MVNFSADFSESSLESSNVHNANSQPLKSEEKQSPIKMRELAPAKRSFSDQAWSVAKFAVKIAFPPITLLVYLIVKSISHAASSLGLGTNSQIKQISQIERDSLKAQGGKEIKFGIKDGAALEGMYFKAEPQANNPDPKTVLICTGSHQSFEYYSNPMVRELKSMGCNVMVFNYEGFGKSEGEQSEEGVYRSVEAAYQYLTQEKGCIDDSIVAWGYSLGSGAVTDLSTRHTVDIVIDRGFSSMSQMAYQNAPRNLKTVAKIIFIIGAHFDNLSKSGKTKGRMFIAQGSYDTNMPAKDHGELLFQKNPNAIYRKVNSGHFHGNEVWFGKGDDRLVVEKFLKGEVENSKE